MKIARPVKPKSERQAAPLETRRDVRRYGIIADDLTGATDVAAAFANCGFTAAVAFAPRSLRSLDAQVVALSTHSRHDNSAGARRKVRQACARLLDGGWPVIYKKL